jgi:hypothetical protein
MKMESTRCTRATTSESLKIETENSKWIENVHSLLWTYFCVPTSDCVQELKSKKVHVFIMFQIPFDRNAKK